MFRPVRMLFLMALAFVAGILFERQATNDACRAEGGEVEAGLCRGLS